MILYELKVDGLKRELGKLELSTTAAKNELQRQLVEELWHRVINTDTYEFADEKEWEIQTLATTSSIDTNSLLTAKMEKKFIKIFNYYKEFKACSGLNYIH